jgi:outer membrane protein
VNRLLKSSLLGFAAALSLVAAPAFADLKIGYIDFGRLMRESPAGKTLSDALNAEAATKRRELESQDQALQAKAAKFQKDQATMTADQNSKMQKDLRDGQRELARRQQEIQDDLNSRSNEELQKLQRSLLQEVSGYAKANNFDLVIADGVMYVQPTLDITSAVLLQLQARGGAPAAARPAAPAATPAAPSAKPPGR